MIVCHCEAVNHRTIEKVIDAGASTPEEVAERCGAGSRCGSCRMAVEVLIVRRAAASPVCAA